MNEIIEYNRKTVNNINEWIKYDNYVNSYFNYGIPGHIYDLISKPINNDICETDIICLNILEFYNSQNYISYLEIGVSVGKTFYQIIQFIKKHAPTNFRISCIEIENINPLLKDLISLDFNDINTTKITKDNTINSIRTNEYNYIHNWNNKIYYYEADEFDKEIWKYMKTKYNIIFSDALHNPSALLEEFDSIINNDLINENGFMYCFDDLEANQDEPMWKAVYHIYNQLKSKFINLDFIIEHLYVNGWLGEHEYKHNFGVIIAKPCASK